MKPSSCKTGFKKDLLRYSWFGNDVGVSCGTAVYTITGQTQTDRQTEGLTNQTSACTDTKPLGVLDLSEYSVLTSGIDITRKSKYAFKLASPRPISNQSQSHVFFLDSEKALENWTFYIQIHINQAITSLLAMAEASARLDFQLREAELNRQKYGLVADGELSIIDKVLDRLYVDDPATPSESTGSPSSHHYDREVHLHNLQPKFMQTYTDNAETWSSVSSMQNTSSNTSSNLDYIFGLSQQTAKSSLDSVRDPQPAYHKKTTSTVSQSSSLNPGYHHFHPQSLSEQVSVSSMSEDGRSTRQSIESQGQQQSRGGLTSVNSPKLHPVWNGSQPGRSIDNHSSPGTSTIESPCSSPTLKPQTLSGLNSGVVPPSPKTFYRILEGSKEAESNGSTTSISSIGSSADASTALESIPDSTTVIEINQGTKHGGSSLFMGLVGGGKHRKDKDRQNGSTNSSNSGSASGSSPGMKLFSSSLCSIKGCGQPSKSCTVHDKKKKLKEKDSKKTLRLWSSSDKNSASGSQNGSERSISPAPGNSKLMTSKSMVSLSRENEFDLDNEPVPMLPNNMLGVFNPNARRRSPSVSVLDDALIAAQARYQQHQQSQLQHLTQPLNLDVVNQLSLTARDLHQKSPSPLLLNAPTHPLPPLPPHAAGSGINLKIETGSDKNHLANSVQDGTFFVANHYRTTQKLKVLQGRKLQPIDTNDAENLLLSPIPVAPATYTFDPQTSMAIGVSRHIIAPDELAQAIEQETEDMRRQQEETKQLQRNRPTSIVHNQVGYSLSPTTNLSTVDEISFEFGTIPEGYSHDPSSYADGEDPECGRIISCQEQLACGSAAIPHAQIQQVARQRSPISGIISASIPQLSNLTLHPHHASGTVTEISPEISPVPSVPSADAPLKSPRAANPTRIQSHGKGLFTSGDKGSIPITHSLPPPRRPGHVESSSYDKVNNAPRGAPRRSSAAAAVGVPTTPPSKQGYFSSVKYDQDGNPILEGNESTPLTPISLLPTSPGVSGVFRPAYMTRRNSSSPVLIRLGEQGVQDISPLLTNGATRTFPGDAPSVDVRRPGITPGSSPAESSHSVSTLGGFAGQDEAGGESDDYQQISGLALGAITPNVMSPTHETPLVSPMAMNNARRFKNISSPSPLAHVLHIDSGSHPSSPIGSPSNTSNARMVLPDADEHQESEVYGQEGSRNLPSMVVNSPQDVMHSKTRSPNTFVQPARPYVFPAPPPGSSAHNVDDHPYSNPNSGRSTPNREEELSRPSSPVIPASALRAHAAALDLYPGLRKLSLFTAAIGGNPPPALISGSRKGSAGSASTRKMSNTSSLSKTSDDDDEDDENQSVDLHHDEDWAGNLRSLRSAPLPDIPSIYRPSLPMLGGKLPSAPPSAPLPPLPNTTSNVRTSPRSTTPSTFTSPSSLQFVSTGSETVYTSQLKPPPPASPVTKSTGTFNDSMGNSKFNGSHSNVVSPPAIPRRSIQRSTSSSPITVRSPNSVQQPVIDHDL
ncbi:hypothetical protein BGZ76_002992 [Entomortierella beljakovae]|nr:hypothetical protein BGZ76_002992 [Entomortierella beljakovae]